MISTTTFYLYPPLIHDTTQHQEKAAEVGSSHSFIEIPYQVLMTPSTQGFPTPQNYRFSSKLCHIAVPVSTTYFPTQDPCSFVTGRVFSSFLKEAAYNRTTLLSALYFSVLMWLPHSQRAISGPSI
jgi:hypothetical protein